MQKLRLLLAASVALNLALLVFALRTSRSAAPAPASPPAQPAPPAAKPEPATPGAALALEDKATLVRAQALLAIDDLPTLVARLRAAGFPPGIVRAVVSTRLAELYGARRKAAVAHQEVVPYWRSSMTFPEDPPAGAAIRALFREQATQLKSLLGPDADATDEWSQMLEQRKFGYLPPEKVELLKRITEDYSDLRGEIFGTARGFFLPEDRAKLALLDQEQRADLAALLTPAELEAYDLRTSSTANQLRAQLSSFQPTEEEFQLIYQLTRAADPAKQTLIRSGLFGPNQPPALSELQKQIEAALGPERAAAYRMTIDPAYQYLNRLATRLALPDTVVAQTYVASQDLRQRAQAIQTDRRLDPADRTRQLDALGREAQTKLTALLGARGYETYRDGAGSWLNELPPRAAPPAK